MPLREILGKPAIRHEEARLDAGFREAIQKMVEHGATGDWQQMLGLKKREGAQSSGKAGAKNDALHESSPPWSTAVDMHLARITRGQPGVHGRLVATRIHSSRIIRGNAISGNVSRKGREWGIGNREDITCGRDFDT